MGRDPAIPAIAISCLGASQPFAGRRSGVGDAAAEGGADGGPDRPGAAEAFEQYRTLSLIR
jgi:hypothetical protein